MMNSLIFYFSKNYLYVFEKDETNKISPFYCKGEEFVYVETDFFKDDFNQLKEYILESLNLISLEEVGYSVIFHDVPQEQLKAFIEVFRPCKEWEVISRDSILPALFYKADILRNRETISVKVDNDTYQVQPAADTKEITLQSSELTPELEWQAYDIASLYYQPFVWDVKPDLELVVEMNKLKEKCSQLEKQAQKESSVQKELRKRIAVLEKENKDWKDQNLKVKNQVDAVNLVGKRRFVTVPRTNQQSSHLDAVSAIASVFTNAFSNNATKKIRWKKLNGDIVSKGDIVAHIMFPDADRDSILIKSPCDGRLHFVAKENQVVGFDKLVGVIADPRDSHEDIQQWVKMLNN